MDFSSLNPSTSNALNLAARNNDVKTVKRLLKKMNPNCCDNRGWTCLHEAAASDSYESLDLILNHQNLNPLVETYDGHTALYLACQYMSSTKTIKKLLNEIPDIANYGSTEQVTPLHVTCGQGRTEVIQLLLDYGAMVDVQDFDGDTPLHDAALDKHDKSVSILLHAGANPEIRNEASLTAFHLACYKGCFEAVENFLPFINDINEIALDGDTPLILAAQGSNHDVVKLLLKNNADPNLKNKRGDLALTKALTTGNSEMFKTLLQVTDIAVISPNIIYWACKPHIFNLDILESLLIFNLGPTFFDYYEQFYITLEKLGEYRPKYLTNAPINSLLSISEYIYTQSRQRFEEFFYLFLMGGVLVNAMDINECPPLVYIHYCLHSTCFKEVLKIFHLHGCNVDYCSTLTHPRGRFLPDAFHASLGSDPSTAAMMLPYSLHCDPEYLLTFAHENGLLGRIPAFVKNELLSMIGGTETCAENLAFTVLPLTHLCRQKIRLLIANTGYKTTDEFLNILDKINIPQILKKYLRYM
ncbi:ankyrin repeat and SOCS box protein 3-like [Danaus plexippus]|uniref:ankyrin repeat and SOCS box protein 3-like n=1 Tax=Danaus plexippus TaxID=13037 RepID=UPI002AB3271F|nr:ankyrin repeat and SOCS box protein 3-like [Danaus plexippus]